MKGKGSTWKQFHVKFGQYEVGQHDALWHTPDANMVYQRAQRVKDSSAVGSDGWAPVELKAVPNILLRNTVLESFS